VLVFGGDVLAAEPELLDEHAFGNRAPLGDLRRRHPALGEVRRGGGQADGGHLGVSRTERMMRASSVSTWDGTRPSPQRMNRIPSSSPAAISAHAETSGSMSPTSPFAIDSRRPST